MSLLSLTFSECLCLQQISTGIHTSKVSHKLGARGGREQGEKDLPMTEECRVVWVLYRLAGELSEVTGLLRFP